MIVMMAGTASLNAFGLVVRTRHHTTAFRAQGPVTVGACAFAASDAR
jgi:hypothetical protein